MKRSITSASATTEHRIRGQMGQPAACMIESKVFSRGVQGCSDEGRAGRGGLCPTPGPTPQIHCKTAPEQRLSTEDVDKHVHKLRSAAQNPRSCSLCIGVLKK